MREEDAEAAIEALGLTRMESRAYLHLLRNGVSTARDVSVTLGVQHPAVYRILHSLQAKGWIEAGRERPSRYRVRNPRVVAEESRRARAEALAQAARITGDLVDQLNTKMRAPESDLFLYKGIDGVTKKLRELALDGTTDLLVVSPFAVDRDVLRLVFASIRAGARKARVVLNEGNRPDLDALEPLPRRGLRVELRFPASPHPATRLAHTFVFPSDRELLIVNSFYRDGVFDPERLQALWIGDADYVRVQLEAMVKGLEPARKVARRRLPTGRPARLAR